MHGVHGMHLKGFVLEQSLFGALCVHSEVGLVHTGCTVAMMSRLAEKMHEKKKIKCSHILELYILCTLNTN